LRGQGRDHEIQPLQPCRRQAEDQADQRGDDARQRNGEEYRNRQRVGEVGRGEGAEQKERGVPDRDLPGEADQNVEAERCDGKDADLDQDAERVGAQQLRRKTQQHDAGDNSVAAGFGRKDRGVGRVSGAVVA
jgi:hypothetical protein